MRVIWIGLVFTVLAGCVTYTPRAWQRPNATEQDLARDRYACRQASRVPYYGSGWVSEPFGGGVAYGGSSGSAPAPSAAGMAQIEANRLFDACMEAKGYVAADKPSGGGASSATTQTSTSEAVKKFFETAWATSERLLPAPAPCALGYSISPRLYVVNVTDWADAAGLRRGDRLTTIGSTMTTTLEENLRAATLLAPATPFEAGIVRSGTSMTIALPCRDSRDVWSSARRMLLAGSEGRWDECIAASVELESRRGMTEYTILQNRLSCLQAKTRAPGRPYGADEAALLHKTMLTLLRESQYVPDALDAARSLVLTNAEVLRQTGYPTLADDLKAQLGVATKLERR